MFKATITSLDGEISRDFTDEARERAQFWLDKQLAKPKYLGMKAREKKQYYVPYISQEEYTEYEYLLDENSMQVIENGSPVIVSETVIPAVYGTKINPLYTDQEILTDDMGVEYFYIPAEYTYEIIDITAEVEAEKIRADRRATGKMVIDLTNAIMETVIGFNMDNPSNIPILISTFSEIHTLLKDYQPFTAKSLIRDIVVSEIVTQEMKDELLALYP